jgi:Zn-dependent peptidase ImmA (M78 family)/predicted secreted protein
MNTRVRLARLKGAKAAQRLLGIMEARKRISETSGQIDVLGVLASLEIMVVFRPLDGLLGAYLRGDTPGVLLSTKRPPSVQRFTAAHELGHAVLEHKPSLDSGDVLRRAASDIEGASPAGFASRLQEIEADAFAGEFLLPSWLIVHHAKTQSWSAADLGTPNIAYQLSLRCGTSYGATVRALLRNQIINGNQSAAALDVKPKLIKRTIRRRAEWSSPWSDTWLLSERDITQDGLPITAGDLVGVQLPQNAGSGFLQRPQLPYPSELTPIADWTDVDETTVGQPGLKTFVLRAEAQGPVKFAFSHGRPWDPGQQVSEFRLAIKEREEGLSRANRIHLGMEAA